MTSAVNWVILALIGFRLVSNLPTPFIIFQGIPPVSFIATRLSRTRHHVAGGGLGAVVLVELCVVGLVLVGLGALHLVVTLLRLQGVLTGHLTERMSVRNALWA